MNRDDFESLANSLLNKAKIIRMKKSTDYQRVSEDVLFNFKDANKSIGVSEVQAVSWAMKKQIDSLLAYAKTKKLESEPIESRIIDSINYLLFYYAILIEKKVIDDEK